MSSSELLRLLERRAGGAGIAKPSESVATGPSGVNSEEEMVVVTGPTRGERKKKEHHRPGVLLTEAYVVCKRSKKGFYWWKRARGWTSFVSYYRGLLRISRYSTAVDHNKKS